MRRVVIVAALLAATSAARAQDNLLPSTSWGFAPIASGWHFAKALATPSGSIQDVAEVAVPFQVRVGIGARWNFDITGAFASAGVHTTGDSSTGRGDKAPMLTGPTDVKVRMSGPIVGDNVVFTAGVNLPVGTTRLNRDQTTVLQTVGAPALHMPIGAYGTGTGGTLGLIGVADAAGWVLALGASVEQRTEYTPIALAISGGSSETRLTPGTAAHVSLGGDRVVGQERLSFLVLADLYGTDKVVLSSGGTETGRTQYQLGPQYVALTRLDFGGGAWSDGALTLSGRYRTAFNDADGKPVAGSAGTYLEGSLGGVLGGGARTGLVLGIDGRWHSGLSFTNALVGAAVTAVGGTIGFELPIGFRFTIQPQYGTFDTGTSHTTGVGGTVALSFFARKGTR
jgi:hypothetical protein